MVMKKELSVALWTLCIYLFNVTAAHSQYKRMALQGGTQQFINNSVNVTYSGPPPTYLGTYHCGYGPYLIGSYSSFFMATSPLSYTFTFGVPVKSIIVDFIDLAESDSVIVLINGTRYRLTNANLSIGPNPCDRDIAIISAGHVVGPPGMSVWWETETVARISIKEPGGINSATVEYLGPVYSNGVTGNFFSFLLGQIDAANNGPVCMNAPLQLLGDPTITEPGTFLWNGPNGFTSDLQSPLIPSLTVNDTGVYTLMYTNGIDTFIDTTHVAFLPGPEIPSITATPAPICMGNTMHLTANSSSSTTFSWSGPNALNSSDPSVSIANMQHANAGIYTVTATKNNCSLSDSIHIDVLQPGIHKVTELACLSEGYNFNGRQLNESGLYTDTFTSVNGCDSFSQLNLVILPSPEVNITADITDKICVGDTISFTATGEENYVWYNNNRFAGNTTTIQTAMPELVNSIMVVGIAQNSCTDTALAEIRTQYCCQVSMPTAFSPNNDSRNETFGALLESNVTSLKMEIFNRWGERMFVAGNIDDRWDGTYKYTAAATGTYFYQLSCICQGGQRIERKGSVVLVR